MGSWAAEGLIRSGISNLSLCDLDEVCMTNSNRQLAAMSSTLGRPKIDVLKERFLDINPDANIHLVHDFVSRDNISDLLPLNTYDYILDAIDETWVKTKIIAHCYRNKQKILSVGASAGLKSPVGICIEDLNRVEGDPLLRFCRNNLRNRLGFPKQFRKKWRLPVVYMPGERPYNKENNACSPSSGPDCDQRLGSSVAVTATMGFVSVSYILQKLIEVES